MGNCGITKKGEWKLFSCNKNPVSCYAGRNAVVKNNAFNDCITEVMIYMPTSEPKGDSLRCLFNKV